MNIENYIMNIKKENIENFNKNKMIDLIQETGKTDNYDNTNTNDNIDNSKMDNANKNKRQLSPTGSTRSVGKVASNNNAFEPKRTANLENLIGNLKVRKMNQTTTNGNGNSKNGKITSLYVDVASTSLSDCSRTPPLSTSAAASPPSISPSSISPDSPVQSQISSLSSSSSSLATTRSTQSSNNENKSNYSIVSKFRLMMGNKEEYEEAKVKKEKLIENEQEVEHDQYEDDDNDEMKLEIEDEEDDEEIVDNENDLNNNNLNDIDCKKTNKKIIADNHQKTKNSKIKQSISKNVNKNNNHNEDPSKAVKFYDDYIDFRGDILRRPPNSKNCRILWEYLFLLLQDSNYSSVIKWEDDSNMVFRIVQAEKLAALWGLQKNRLGMTYEKLSRGMRYYYPNNIIAREPGRRLLYRFMRHPDEIKKFVKKNGTYMLKRAKIGGKNDDSNIDSSLLNPEDSGLDEPSKANKITAKSNIQKKSTKNNLKTKNFNDDDNEDEFDEEEESYLDEEQQGEQEQETIDENNNNFKYGAKNDKNKNSNAKLATKTKSLSKNGENNSISNKSNNTSKSSSPAPFLNNIISNSTQQHQSSATSNLNNFNQDLYQYMYSAQMAAYLSRFLNNNNTESNNNDLGAAQFLMQLNNLNNDSPSSSSSSSTSSISSASLNNHDLLNESIQNIASTFNLHKSLGILNNTNNNTLKNYSNMLLGNHNLFNISSSNTSEHPLNLSINNSNNNHNDNSIDNKKRKTKYDTAKLKAYN